MHEAHRGCGCSDEPAASDRYRNASAGRRRSMRGSCRLPIDSLHACLASWVVGLLKEAGWRPVNTSFAKVAAIVAGVYGMLLRHGAQRRVMSWPGTLIDASIRCSVKRCCIDAMLCRARERIDWRLKGGLSAVCCCRPSKAAMWTPPAMESFPCVAVRLLRYARWPNCTPNGCSAHIPPRFFLDCRSLMPF